MNTTIHRVEVSAFKIPTDGPESDGTLTWDSTTLVLVRVQAGGVTGLGFTYAGKATATLIHEKLASLVAGSDAMDIERLWELMIAHLRNLGRPGISAMAVSAVDVALWDLKAKLLDLPLVKLLGQVRPGILAYGSGGFTSYTIERLQQQMSEWAKAGLRCAKMKVGREPDHDLARVKAAREALGTVADLYVDANGAYGRKQALAMAEQYAEVGVKWFEEPVVSDDLQGLRFIRERAPASMVVAAGEYGYDLSYFRRMLEAGAVDVLQADVTRCAGITGFMGTGVLCEAFTTPLSAHTSPSIHQHPGCALGRACSVEYFYDHYRIEEMLFDGAARPVDGELHPDLSRPGLGLEFKQADANRYLV
ncbi:MAG TPA: enolase C-terminal domain-like protein [Verrucomicrobiae bacterium]|nr:enolase C-terminal domain-like protein [Verrucomicrobiae bacterium]